MQNNRRAARASDACQLKVQPREILFATLEIRTLRESREHAHSNDGKIFPADSRTNEANNKNGRFPNLCAISGISVPNYYLNYKSRICIGKGQEARQPKSPSISWERLAQPVSRACVSKAHFRFIVVRHKEKSKRVAPRGDFYILLGGRRQSYGAQIEDSEKWAHCVIEWIENLIVSLTRRFNKSAGLAFYVSVLSRCLYLLAGMT